MTFNSIIIKFLSERCGCDVTTPAGSTTLAHDIESQTGEKLSPNTLKRLVGVLPYKFAPRNSTLEILAQYLGFSSWDLFLAKINDSISDFNVDNPFVEVRQLPLDAQISFCWEPDRNIRLRHLGEGRCMVTEVANSKLVAGDILALTQLAEEYPLIAKDVVRDGRSIGNYLAAKTNGISNLIIE